MQSNKWIGETRSDNKLAKITKKKAKHNSQIKIQVKREKYRLTK